VATVSHVDQTLAERISMSRIESYPNNKEALTRLVLAAHTSARRIHDTTQHRLCTTSHSKIQIAPASEGFLTPMGIHRMPLKRVYTYSNARKRLAGMERHLDNKFSNVADDIAEILARRYLYSEKFNVMGNLCIWIRLWTEIDEVPRGEDVVYVSFCFHGKKGIYIRFAGPRGIVEGRAFQAYVQPLKDA